MNDQTDALDQTEDEILSHEVSDETLEVAGDRAALATFGPGSCLVPGGAIC